ncbi:MAG: hypothetical protein HYZ53_09995 [Planctomycetes bacterium]|nr:hypothetical protein [Planctomycetota bacterium]
MRLTSIPLAALVLLLASAAPLSAQPAVLENADQGDPDLTATAPIAWFGSLQQGFAEAKRTGKAILVFSATPQCHNIPGVW